MSIDRQTLLMCAPEYFGVNYVINPWMLEGLGKAERDEAQRQWENLKREMFPYADIVLVTPRPGLPDMVFTANAGMVLGKKAIVSRFHDKERQGEEPFFRAWFEQNDFEIVEWPQDIAFEGAGDALFDREQNVIWAAHGFRSDKAAAPLLEKIFERRAVPLQLADARFYHLDTCLCPLDGGYLMYYPAAFKPEAQKTIMATVPPEKLIPVSDADAFSYACNAVELNHHIFMNGATSDLQLKLRGLGLTPVIAPLGEFMKSGGAAKCLTLKLWEE